MCCFTACHVGRIPTGCTLSRMGRHLSHPAENIYETYCCIQILTIPAADFIGWTANSSSTSPSVPLIWMYIHSVPGGGLWCAIMRNHNCLKPTLLEQPWCDEYIHPELFLLLMTSLFTFHYHFLWFSCYWRRPVPYIFLTLPHIFLSFVTLHLILPYLISYLSLPYLVPYLTLHFALPYLTLHFAFHYLTLPYLTF